MKVVVFQGLGCTNRVRGFVDGDEVGQALALLGLVHIPHKHCGNATQFFVVTYHAAYTVKLTRTGILQ